MLHIIPTKARGLLTGILWGMASGLAMAQTPAALTCSTTSYLFQNNDTDIYELDLTNGKSTQKTSGGIPGIATSTSNTGAVKKLNACIATSTSNTGAVKKLNAFGFNQADNYIWAQVYGTALIARIGKDNIGNYLGQTFTTSGLPTPSGNSNNFAVGDISPSGIMYLTLGGSNADTNIYGIDLTAATSALTAVKLTSSLTYVTDWAVSPIDNNIYGIYSSKLNNGNPDSLTLYRFKTSAITRNNLTNTTTIKREVLGQVAGGSTPITANTYGSAFMDVNGSLYVISNNGGAVYRIDSPDKLAASRTATITATYLGTPNLTSSNTDGARCSAAKVVPLPVTLTSFVATAAASRSVQLTWTTANEQNNDRFEVQRSTDGQIFATLGQVAGHQTTTQASAYSFADATPGTATTHYYRLRQVDLDGTSSYSPVRAVQLAATSAPWQLAVAPNPTAASDLHVQVQSETTVPSVAVLEVRGLLGQCVFKQPVALQPGSNDLVLGTHLAPGMYWLKLSSEAAPATKGIKVLLTN